jgi:hypothetical protein
MRGIEMTILRMQEMGTYGGHYTVCSESRCALRLGYVDLVFSVEGAVEACCCFNCIQLLNSG